MSAPSALHESRVDLLEDLATLAGYSLPVDAWFAERPDVVRLHRARPALLAGDAKATESPKNGSTRTRLSHYAEACAEWLRAGFAVDLAMVHGPDSGGAWGSCLVAVVESVGLRAALLSGWDLDDSDWVTWVRLVAR